MKSRLASIVTILALLALCLVPARCGSVSKTKTVDKRTRDRHQASESLASSLQAALHPVPGPNAKRMIPSGFSLFDGHVFDFIQPVDLAARGLERFYGRMLREALLVWPNFPEATSWRMRLGAFQCVMAASGAEGVPWTFVAEFARMMTVMTSLGFTSTYQMTFRRMGNGFILVTMIMQTAEQMADLMGEYRVALGPPGSR
ncbi:MAG: hypothetical protein LQ339_008567 [Xanthoria mediterranea]|nr:MAG: hypothetical protein LQ339_008567 [Xanthoria mediterranea]